MSLHLPTPPASARRVAHAALESHTARRRAHIPTLLATRHRTLDFPHQVHRLELGEQPDPARQPVSRPVGWRFLTHPDEDPPVAVETMHTADGEAFSHFVSGPFVGATVRALRQARLLPQVGARRFEPRLLSIPELYMMTLWLHRPDAEAGHDGDEPASGQGRPGRAVTYGPPLAGDLLIPLAPAPPGLGAYQVRRAEELLPLLAQRVALLPVAGGH